MNEVGHSKGKADDMFLFTRYLLGLRGNTGRRHRPSSRVGVKITAAVCGTAALLAGVLAVMTPGVASAHHHPNLLTDPGFETANPSGSYFVDCSGSLPCGPSNQVAAADWDILDAADSNGALWATTDRTRTTLPDGGHWMLHVTGTGAGIEEYDTFSVTSANWSVSVFPVMGNVTACIGHTGHPSGDPLSCDTAATLGTWQQLSGTYDGGSGDVTATQITIDGVTSDGPTTTPYTDFYVDNASVIATG
jgi:hypothetical protein